MGGGPFGTFDLPAVRAFIRIFAPRRGEIVVDADALDLQPPRSVRPATSARTPRGGRAASAIRRGREAPARRRPSAVERWPRRRRRRAAGSAGRPAARARMTLEIDVLTLFPAMVEGPLVG